MNPVSGDLVTTANLLEVVSRVPTSGLVTNISGLAGDRGFDPSRAEPVKKVCAQPGPAYERLKHRLL